MPTPDQIYDEMHAAADREDFAAIRKLRADLDALWRAGDPSARRSLDSFGASYQLRCCEGMIWEDLDVVLLALRANGFNATMEQMGGFTMQVGLDWGERHVVVVDDEEYDADYPDEDTRYIVIVMSGEAWHAGEHDDDLVERQALTADEVVEFVSGTLSAKSS